MLADVLKAASWESVTDGAVLYRFGRDSAPAQSSCTLDRNRASGPRLELFFCCGGAIILQSESGASVRVGRGESILLSDVPNLDSLSIQEPPIGYALVIDPETCSALGDIYRAMGYTAWSYEQVETFLQSHGRCLQLKNSSWNQSLFSTLYSLPDPEQGPYCVLKAAELFYMISSRQALVGHIARQTAMPAHLVKLMRGIGAYIEEHLDEKLTIALLCHQFNLSPTTLKNKFREFYGQPIHSWILYRRVLRAAELLKTTDMTALQIAQSVGYESASQFNVVFRRAYGVAPSVYRKCLISKKSG